ncbi:MAG TPA: periplasmic heavy metal sensor [Chroococcales cyanobacterium]
MNVMFPPFPPGPPGMMPPPFPVPGSLDGFVHAFVMSGQSLSDEQVEKIAQSKRNFNERSEPHRAACHALECDIQNALTAPEVNAAEISRLSAKLQDERRQIDDLLSAQTIATAQALTADQRKQMRAAMHRAELGPLGAPAKESKKSLSD